MPLCLYTVGDKNVSLLAKGLIKDFIKIAVLKYV